jgi:hypothetical protein
MFIKFSTTGPLELVPPPWWVSLSDTPYASLSDATAQTKQTKLVRSQQSQPIPHGKMLIAHREHGDPQETPSGGSPL